MIGVLLATHGNIGISILDAANNIIGSLENVAALDLRPGEGAVDLRNRMKQSLTELDSGDGALILVDIQGGTPGNVSLTLMEEHKIEILSGLNLSMLICLLGIRKDNDLASLTQRVLQKGQAGVLNLRKEWLKHHESCTN